LVILSQREKEINCRFGVLTLRQSNMTPQLQNAKTKKIQNANTPTRDDRSQPPYVWTVTDEDSLPISMLNINLLISLA
jgi:hypothetical protein